MIAVTPEMIDAVKNCAATVSKRIGAPMAMVVSLLSRDSNTLNVTIIKVTMIIGICASSESFKNSGKYSL